MKSVKPKSKLKKIAQKQARKTVKEPTKKFAPKSLKSTPDIRNIKLNPGKKPGLKLDVAIIGAGTSGLYSAWRLTTKNQKIQKPLPASKVQIFDMADRIGGRLESVQLPGMDVIGELGGMRYMTSQEIVTTLIEDVFKNLLTPKIFPMGNDAHLFAYFRKQRMMQNAWQQAQKKGQKFETRYYLDNDDVGFSSDQLFNKIIYDVLSADPWFMKKYGSKIKKQGQYNYEFTLTSRDWDDVKPKLIYNFQGPYYQKKVNDIGFWNLIKDQVSQEGYNFLADAGGYYSNTINWNAAEAMPYMVGDFSNAGTQYKTLADGYDGIAYALAWTYMQQKGATIWSENQLITFKKTSNPVYRYELIFYNLRSKKQWKVQAKKIILAMPRRSLELLDQENFFFDPETQKELQRNMASVIMEPSYKILMGFEKPWWREDFGALAGHSITDLPMRQCYYFGTDPKNSHSLLLGSYNDMRTTPFWEVLANDKLRFKPKLTKLVTKVDRFRGLGEVQATQVMVDEAVKQLQELHGPDVPVPQPYVTWYKDWSLDPFGGGYHAWKAAYSVKEVMPYMRKPQKKENIFICGEAYSDQQGWVEGAFCVAENMLQEHFGLRRPDWLDKSYYLGW